MSKSYFEYPIAIVWDLMHTYEGAKILEWQNHPSSYYGWDSLHKESLERRVSSFPNAVSHDTRHYPFVIKAANDDKAIMSSFLGADIPNMFPKQKTYTATMEGGLGQKVIEDFPDSKYLVLKTPRDAGGRGVYFTNNASIKNCDNNPKLAIMFGASVIQDINFPFGNRRHFIAQEGLKPIPVAISVKKGENFSRQFCLPTIRLVSTIEPLKDRTFRWHIHGAYYKLPAVSFKSEEDAFNEEINALESRAVLSKVFDENGGSRSVPDKVLSEICDQMEAGLRPLFERVRQESPQGFVLRALQSENPADHVSAVEFLLNYHEERQMNLLTLKPEVQEAVAKAVHNNPLLFGMLQKRNAEWSAQFTRPPMEGLLSMIRVPDENFGDVMGGLYR